MSIKLLHNFINTIQNNTLAAQTNKYIDNTGTIHLTDKNTSNTISLCAPNNLTQSCTLILPTTTGENQQVLTTDGQGNLSWTSPVISVNAASSDQSSNKSADQTIAGDLNVDGLTTVNNHTVNGDANIKGMLVVDGITTTSNQTICGNLTVGGNITTVGDTICTGNLVVNGAISLPKQLANSIISTNSSNNIEYTQLDNAHFIVGAIDENSDKTIKTGTILSGSTGSVTVDYTNSDFTIDTVQSLTPESTPSFTGILLNGPAITDGKHGYLYSGSLNETTAGNSAILNSKAGCVKFSGLACKSQSTLTLTISNSAAGSVGLVNFGASLGPTVAANLYLKNVIWTPGSGIMISIGNTGGVSTGSINWTITFISFD
jgi:hypothetical protein